MVRDALKNKNISYYQTDKRCGDVVTINGKNAYDLFNADISSFELVAGPISARISNAVGNSSFSVHGYKFGTGGIKTKFYVGGMNKSDSDVNMSNFIKECGECVLRIGESEFEYASVLTAFNVKDTGIDFYNEVELSFSAIKRLPLVTKRFDGGTAVFENEGNVNSGLLLKITSSIDLAEATVAGITIRNLQHNLPFVIDGLDGSITCNGVNRFLDTDLIEFPKVLAGTNSILFDTNIVLELSYYPTFII